MDGDRQKKPENKQLNDGYWEAMQRAALSCAEIRGGIVKFVSAGVKDESWRTIQGAHNANHALTHLSFMMFRCFLGKNPKNLEASRERILAHLRCLKEFIPCDDHAIKNAVDSICMNLQSATLGSLHAWALFILQNWETTRVLAGRYSEADRCFPASEYQRLQAFVSGDVKGMENSHA